MFLFSIFIYVKYIFEWKISLVLIGLLELEHDLVPPVPELHGAVVAGGQEVVAVHLVESLTCTDKKFEGK